MQTKKRQGEIKHDDFLEEWGNKMVAGAGFEPAISGLMGQKGRSLESILSSMIWSLSFFDKVVQETSAALGRIKKKPGFDWTKTDLDGINYKNSLFIGRSIDDFALCVKGEVNALCGIPSL